MSIGFITVRSRDCGKDCRLVRLAYPKGGYRLAKSKSRQVLTDDCSAFADERRNDNFVPKSCLDPFIINYKTMLIICQSAIIIFSHKTTSGGLVVC